MFDLMVYTEKNMYAICSKMHALISDAKLGNSLPDGCLQYLLSCVTRLCLRLPWPSSFMFVALSLTWNEEAEEQDTGSSQCERHSDSPCHSECERDTQTARATVSVRETLRQPVPQ